MLLKELMNFKDFMSRIKYFLIFQKITYFSFINFFFEFFWIIIFVSIKYISVKDAKVLWYYVECKYIKLISMYNKLCNKKYELFFNVSYLHKGQGSPNEFWNVYKWLDLIELCSFHGIIFHLSSFLQWQKQF
jgi:hypothetical protein